MHSDYTLHLLSMGWPQLSLAELSYDLVYNLISLERTKTELGHNKIC